MRRPSLLLAVSALALLAGAGAARATAPPAPLRVERPEEDRLLFTLHLGRHILAEGASAYRDGSRLLLSLEDFVTALDLPIAVRPEDGTAAGWMIREDRGFALDAASGEARIAGRLEPIEAGGVEIHADGLYVDTALLARWFPVDLRPDFSELALAVLPREPLPLEENLERAERWRRAAAGRPSQAPLPPFPLPYRKLDWPALDAQVDLSLFRSAEATYGHLSQSALAEGDFLGLNAQLFLSARADLQAGTALDGARFSLGRRDPDGQLLGPLRATEYRLGDLASPGDLLVAGSVPGLGAEVSNFPISAPIDFDRVTLRGDALPGWDVELYRNDALLRFARVGEDGRYEMSDIPLVPGLNVLRVVLYGGQGQRRERIEKVFVGSGLPAAGETRYRAGVYRQGEGLLEEARLPPDQEAARGELRHFGELERGLGRRLAVRAGFASLPLADGRHTYSRLGLRAAAPWGGGSLEMIADRQGGTAAEARFDSRLGRWALTLRQVELRDFESEQIRDDDGTASLTEVRLGGQATPFQGWPGLSLDLGLRRRSRPGEGEDLEIDSGLATHLRGLSLSNRLALRLDDGRRSGDGALLASGWGWGVLWRGELSYQLAPRAEPSSFSLTGDWLLGDDRRLFAGVSRNLIGDGTSRLTAGLRWRSDPALLGVHLSAATDRSVQAGLSLAFSLSREPGEDGPWRMRADSSARQGMLWARAFLDRDLDGRFGPGDEPLSGVEMAVNGLHNPGATDRRGLVLVLAPPDQPIDVVLRPESLEDPAWVPARDGIRLVARPGRSVLVDFPVIVTGEIEGRTLLRRAGDAREVANVHLQLVDSKGNVAADAHSQFDGYFLFEKVRPGRYRLRVEPAQAERLQLAVQEGREIEIASGAVLQGIDLALERIEPAGSPP